MTDDLRCPYNNTIHCCAKQRTFCRIVNNHLKSTQHKIIKVFDIPIDALIETILGNLISFLQLYSTSNSMLWIYFLYAKSCETKRKSPSEECLFSSTFKEYFGVWVEQSVLKKQPIDVNPQRTYAFARFSRIYKEIQHQRYESQQVLNENYAIICLCVLSSKPQISIQ